MFIIIISVVVLALVLLDTLGIYVSINICKSIFISEY